MKKYITNYERDKYETTDSKQNKFADKIETSEGWIIRLIDEKRFQFRGTNKIINGTWGLERKVESDYYLKFQFDSSVARARLNGTVIAFDKPEKLFDSIFEKVIFIETRKTFE